MIVNRADREDTTRVDLPCRCPGQSHTLDSAQVVKLFGYGDRSDIRWAGEQGGQGAFFQLMLLRGVVSWTLTLEDGKARPVTAYEIALLDEGTVNALVEALDPAFAEEPIPKASSARSRAGSRAKRSRTRTTRTTDSSTTS